MNNDILDAHFEAPGMDQISDRVLFEIKLSPKKYPKKVIQLVTQEIDARRLVVDDFVFTEDTSENVGVNVAKWMKDNPLLSVLALIAAVSSLFIGMISTGLIGFAIVLISVYASIHLSRGKKIWRRVKLFLFFLGIAGGVLLWML